jgi:thioredoxin-like negative regulator of GroEL
MRILATFLLSFTVLLATSAGAAPAEQFDAQRFAQAQKDGSPILVDIAASWCPTCAAQKPLIERLLTQPEFRRIRVFRVDFDAQKDVVRRFHATEQSTLIAFKGSREVARSVGDTREPSIQQLLRAATGS